MKEKIIDASNTDRQNVYQPTGAQVARGAPWDAPCAGGREAPLFRVVLYPSGEGGSWASALPASYPYSLRQEAMGCPRAQAWGSADAGVDCDPGELIINPQHGGPCLRAVCSLRENAACTPRAIPSRWNLIPLSTAPHPEARAPTISAPIFHTQGGHFHCREGVAMTGALEPWAGVFLQGTAQPALGEGPCGVRVPAQEACPQFPLNWAWPAGARKVRHLQTHPFLTRGGASCQAPRASGAHGGWWRAGAPLPASSSLPRASHSPCPQRVRGRRRGRSACRTGRGGGRPSPRPAGPSQAWMASSDAIQERAAAAPSQGP